MISKKWFFVFEDNLETVETVDWRPFGPWASESEAMEGFHRECISPKPSDVCYVLTNNILQMIDVIKSADVNDDIAFQNIIQEVIDAEILSKQELAHRFSASVPTIDRWISGAGSPHPIMRKVVYSFLVEILEKV